MLTKIVLTNSLISQLSKNVSGVPQSILDRFLTSCEETQHFYCTKMRKIGRFQLFWQFSQSRCPTVSKRFQPPKGITLAPQTPNIRHLTQLSSHLPRVICRTQSIFKTVDFTRFANLVNTGQHLLTKNIFVEK